MRIKSTGRFVLGCLWSCGLRTQNLHTLRMLCCMLCCAEPHWTRSYIGTATASLGCARPCHRHRSPPRVQMRVPRKSSFISPPFPLPTPPPLCFAPRLTSQPWVPTTVFVRPLGMLSQPLSACWRLPPQHVPRPATSPWPTTRASAAGRTATTTQGRPRTAAPRVPPTHSATTSPSTRWTCRRARPVA